MGFWGMHKKTALKLCIMIFTSLVFASHANALNLLCEENAEAGFDSSTTSHWEPLAYELDRSKRASFVFKEPSLDDVDFTGLFGDGPYAFVAVRPGLGLVAACPIGPNQSGYMKCKGIANDLMINIKTKRFMKITSGGYLFDKVEWGAASMTIGTCKAF